MSICMVCIKTPFPIIRASISKHYLKIMFAGIYLN
jgi:hypothetical protein